MNRALLGVVVLVAVAGCSYSTMLTNQVGDIRRCSSAGWGIVGGTLAAAQHDSCVEDMKRLGYTEMSKSSAESPVAATAARVVADQKAFFEQARTTLLERSR